MERSYDWHTLIDDYLIFQKYFPTNQVFSYRVGNKQICLVKTEKSFYAFDEKCPHNGASLSLGYCGKDESIICPLHRYHFSLETGKGLSGVASELKIYPLKVVENKILIGF